MVIAIIAIMAALLLPALSRSMAKARQTQCSNNVRQLGQSLQHYVDETRQYPILSQSFVTNGQPIPFNTWEMELNRYLSSGSGVDLRKGVWRCPSVKSEGILEGAFASYGYNAFGVGDGLISFGLGATYGLSRYPDFGPAIDTSLVIRPSDMIAIGDGFHGNGTNLFPGQSLLWRHNNFDGFRDIEKPESRHNAKANIVFVDGHVESSTLKVLFEDTSDASLVRWNRDHQPHKP